MSLATDLWWPQRIESSFVHETEHRVEAFRSDQAELGWVTTETADPKVSVDLIEGVPASFVEMYSALAVRHARVSEVDDGCWYADVVGLDGAYGEGDSPDEAIESLQAAVHGWVAVKLRVGAMVPPIDGLDLNKPRD